jgi:membrane protein YdbS with pleckstrin-like domain
VTAGAVVTHLAVPFAAVRTVEIEVATLDPEFHVVTVTFETAEGAKELPLVAHAPARNAGRPLDAHPGGRRLTHFAPPE